jgi:hypothetical protein
MLHPVPQRNPSERRVTAQLVVSDTEAYVGYSERRVPTGPNGESHIAHILHTMDAGRTWSQLGWSRSILSLGVGAFATWPPEDVLDLAIERGVLTLTFRDEWVPFEPGGESLWCARLRGRRWHLRWVRWMRYETDESAAAIPTIDVALPPSIHHPFAARRRPPFR